MNRSKQISLFITVLLWGTLIGGIVYSHVVFMSVYLHHLPESTNLINGPYGLHDERFWMFIHPVLILSMVLSLLVNWRNKERRKYMLFSLGIYVSVLAVTFAYFVPELLAFAESAASNVPKAEWLERGGKWEKLSWIRGAFMYAGFGFLLMAFGAKKPNVISISANKKMVMEDAVSAI